MNTILCECHTFFKITECSTLIKKVIFFNPPNISLRLVGGNYYYLNSAARETNRDTHSALVEDDNRCRT